MYATSLPRPSKARAAVAIPRVIAGGVLLAAIAIATGLVMSGHGEPHCAAAWRMLVQHPHAPVLCALPALAFVILRGMLLAQSAAAAGLRVALPSACRLFCEGVAVELVSWPGKLWADGYRAAAISRDGTARQRVLALALFRGGTLLGAALAAAAALAFAAGGGWPWALALVFLAAAGVGLGASRPAALAARPLRLTFRLAILAAAGSACDAAAIALAAWIIAGVDPLAFAAFYILSAIGVSLAGLPMGLGLLDLLCWQVLIQRFRVDPASAAAIVALYRATGPLLTVLLGALGLALRLVRLAPAARAHSPVPTSPSVARSTSFSFMPAPELLQ